ncbi:MAG TPA: helix-turn-helix domain-containing protein [Candidatus Dormibacteraeota bacterium]|jgi:excisionase family DNA binding protein
MTLREAAEQLGLSLKTVQVQVRRQKLRAEKRGRDYWIVPSEVERYRRESLGKRLSRK